MDNAILGKKIKQLRTNLKMSQTTLAEKCGYSHKAMISKIENGEVNLNQKQLELFASVLKCDIKELLNIKQDIIYMDIIGDVSCGYNGSIVLYSNGEQECIPTDWFHNQPIDNYFLLKAKSDSMFPDIKDGDLVLCKKQSTCDYSGQLAVCFYDNDSATLKEIRYGNGYLEMIPYNRSYPVKKITGEELNNTYILGIVCRIIRKFK